MFRKQKQNTQPAVFSKKWIYGRRIQALQELIEDRYILSPNAIDKQRFWTLIDLRAHLIRELEGLEDLPKKLKDPAEDRL